MFYKKKFNITKSNDITRVIKSFYIQEFNFLKTFY